MIGERMRRVSIVLVALAIAAPALAQRKFAADSVRVNYYLYVSGGRLIVGNANAGAPASAGDRDVIQVQSDTSADISVYRIYPGPHGRHISLLFDDINDYVSLISGETGTPPGFGGKAYPLTVGSGNAPWAIIIYEDSVSVTEKLKAKSGLHVVTGGAIIGNINSGSVAGDWPGETLQVHGDTTMGVSAYRIYPGPHGRHISLMFDDINDKVSLISGETGTPPGFGGKAYPLTVGSGSAPWAMEFYEDSIAVREKLRIQAGLQLEGGAGSGYFWRGTDAAGNGEWVKPEPRFADAIASFPTPTNGAVLDTVGGIEEVYNFDVGDTVTIKWLVPVGGDLDSLVLNLSTPDAAGDSSKFGFKYRVRSSGHNVTGAFSEDTYTKTIDMIDGGEKIVRMKIVIDEGVPAGAVLLGKIFRMAAAANECAGVVRLHEKLAYFK